MKNFFTKMISKVKCKYTKRTFKVDDKDIVTEFHPEFLFPYIKKYK